MNIKFIDPPPVFVLLHVWCDAEASKQLSVSWVVRMTDGWAKKHWTSYRLRALPLFSDDQKKTLAVWRLRLQHAERKTVDHMFVSSFLTTSDILYIFLFLYSVTCLFICMIESNFSKPILYGKWTFFIPAIIVPSKFRFGTPEGMVLDMCLRRLTDTVIWMISSVLTPLPVQFKSVVGSRTQKGWSFELSSQTDIVQQSGCLIIPKNTLLTYLESRLAR